MPKDPAKLVAKYGEHAPTIANREKWFPDSSYGELSHIRFRISSMADATARDIAFLALSRTVLAASFQDSETRYKSVPREIPVGEVTRRFVKEFESVMKSVARNASATRYGVSRFLTGDVRSMSPEDFPDGSVDLVVTSPPYGNAMDYHLYHRFRPIIRRNTSGTINLTPIAPPLGYNLRLRDPHLVHLQFEHRLSIKPPEIVHPR
jgi:hypothetical protein